MLSAQQCGCCDQQLSRHPVMPAMSRLAGRKLSMGPQRVVGKLLPRRCQRPAGPTASLAEAALLSAAPVAALSGFNIAGSNGTSSMLASVVGFSLAALLYLRSMQVEQTDSNLPECPRCEGTGFTDCVCTRWSDGDYGCATCRGTGKAVCPSCGGGGRAMPIRQDIRVSATDRD